MIIKSIQIRGFRAIQELSLPFEPGLTTLVGENGTGKSTIALAFNTLASNCRSPQPMDPQNYPYGVFTPSSIEATFDLTSDEIFELVSPSVIPEACSSESKQLLAAWLHNQGTEIKVTQPFPDASGHRNPAMTLGDLQFAGDRLGIGTDSNEGSAVAWTREAIRIAESHSLIGDGLVSKSDAAQRMKNTFGVNRPTVADLGRFIQDHFKVLDDFRVRANLGSRSGAVESLTGADTASVLLNLKSHRMRDQSDRYNKITNTFTRFYPRFKIEAVEQVPGQGSPEVLFYESGRSSPLSYTQVSAGMQQVLTLITNLVGREGLIFFLEHPEEHLHPHTMRAVQSLLYEYKERNQIIVITHNSHFVDPRTPVGLRRVAYTLDKGAVAVTPHLPQESPARDRCLGQMGTALRRVGDREVVFARSVLLVEDESQQEFLTAVAPTLGYDIDSASVSIIAVDGHDGYQAYQTVLEALEIPYIALRDKSWGHNPRYPADKFFSLDGELEECLDNHELSELRREVEKEVGTSKRRVAGLLGSRLSREQIPPIFDTVLQVAMRLSIANPQS